METEGVNEQVNSRYGHHIRVRVSGILLVDDSILSVGHRMKSTGDQLFWAPPGGGLEFGESMEQALQREFLEETGLMVAVGELLSVTEFLNHPLHAVELFFRITHYEGELRTGQDPEHGSEPQLIQEVSFKPISELQRMSADEAHQVLRKFRSFEENGPWKGLLYPSC